MAGGDRDDVEEFYGLVGKGAEGLLGGEYRYAAADVAGERFDFLERGEFGVAGTGGSG